MLPSVEVLAIGLILGLYLQDTVLLLYDNEGVLESTGPGQFRVLFGARSFNVAGRNPLVPNPLTPWRPLFRFAWHVEASSSQDLLRANTTPESVQAALDGLAWATAVIASGLLVGLPTCLYWSLGWVPFVAVVAVTYLGVVGMLVHLWRKRAQLGIGISQLIGLTFESLVCAPCALNLPRKVSSRVNMPEDLLDAARGRLSKSEFHRAVELIIGFVDEDLKSAEADSAEWSALTQYRARLAGRLA